MVQRHKGKRMRNDAARRRAYLQPDLTNETDKVKVKLRKYRQNMVVPTGFEPVLPT